MENNRPNCLIIEELKVQADLGRLFLVMLYLAGSSLATVLLTRC